MLPEAIGLSVTTPRHTGGRTYGYFARYLPAKVAARLDHVVPEKMIPGRSGPFNGQIKRVELVGEILKAVPFVAVVETGTYRGATTEFLRAEARVPVYTVELHPRYYEFSRLRFRRDPEIHCRRGDSRDFLRELAKDQDVPRERVLFYLDAHWNVKRETIYEPPLRDELRTVASHWTESVVLVDDFAVPDDPGYGHDVYPFGSELTLGYVTPEEIGSPAIFWPAAPAAEETGARRGSAIFAYGNGVAHTLAGLRTLRGA